MKQSLLLSVLLISLSVKCGAQELEPLNAEWLANDYRSIELISLLASPAPLTTQRIMDILGVPDKDDAGEDLGFGAIRFDVRKGHGYTSLSVEAFVFRGTIGSYKLKLDSSRESWPRIRERMMDLGQKAKALHWFGEANPRHRYQSKLILPKRVTDVERT